MGIVLNFKINLAPCEPPGGITPVDVLALCELPCSKTFDCGDALG